MKNTDTEGALTKPSADSDDLERRYRHLIENIQDAVVEFEFVDGEPIVRSANDAFEETFGYDEAEICGSSLNDRIVPDSQRRHASNIDSDTESGEITSNKLTRETASGMREFLHRSIPYPESEAIDGIAIYTDITEQERAKQKRQLIAETSRCIGEAQTLENGFETAIQAICEYTDWIYGEVWQPTNCDRDLSFTVGYTETVTTEPLLQASKGATFVTGEGLPGRVYESGSSEWITDVSAEPASVFKRTAVAAELNLHAAFGAPVVADGKVVAVLVFLLDEHRSSDRALIRDVTDVAAHLGGLVARKQAEAKVRQRNEQLETFADVVSHDLRNPLTVILGRLDQITPTSDDTEHIAAIERSATRMETMIADLLSFARSGQTVDAFHPVPLASVAQDSWQTVQLDNAEFDLRVPDNVTVEADPDRLMNVFENLFRNAREHNDSPVTIRVGLLNTGEELHGSSAGFFIEDDGVGISPNNRDCIFECGVTTNADGTGFGLSIVREVVESHGWMISATDSEMGGARFEITGIETAAE